MSRGRLMARCWGREFENTNDHRFLTLAMKAGVSSFSVRSRPVTLARIGKGQEGVVDLRIRECCGQVVATAYKTIASGSPWHSEAMLRRQAQFGEAMTHCPAVARFIDAGVLSNGDHYLERAFIPGIPLSRMAVQSSAILRKLYFVIRLRLAREFVRVGAFFKLGHITVLDAKPGNMILDERSGCPVCVDLLPFRKTELYSNALRRKYKVQETSPILAPSGEALFPNMERSPTSQHANIRKMESQITGNAEHVDTTRFSRPRFFPAETARI